MQTTHPRKTARFHLALAAAKATKGILRLTHHSGTQVPGVVAEAIDPNFLAQADKPECVVCVTGTNGKTTTTNLLDDILTACGVTYLDNRNGANIRTGFESVLADHASLGGRMDAELAVFELDELSTRLILPHMTPRIIACTNLYRDSFMRNANPDFIFGVLSANISPETELVLNADDLISCRLAPQATKRTYFSIGHLDDDTDGPQGVVCDLTACPECGAPLEYEWCHLRHIGRAHCTSCGFTNPEPDFEVVRVDRDAHTFTVRENGEPGRPEHDYRIGTYSITNLYNLLTAIVVARRMGLSASRIAGALDRGVEVTAARYGLTEVGGKRIVNVASKGENGTATSVAFNTIRREPGRKAVVLTLSDKMIHESRYSSEYTGWHYLADFEDLVDDQIRQVVIMDWHKDDIRLRLRLAGMPDDRIVAAEDPAAAADLVDLDAVDSVYIAYDIFSSSIVDACRARLVERLEGRA